jgi:anthranilate 3-monooxygenase (FAD) / 4-hydroxyphenylacetate 3-monooxygenase
VFDDVLVPWERVFINGDIEASNSLLVHGPGFALLQASVRGVVKLRFMAGLACHLAEAIGRTAAPHVEAQLGELIAKVELGNGLLRAAAQDVVAARREGTSLRALAAALWVFIPEAQMRAAEIIRQLSGSGLIMTPTEQDFNNPEIAPYLQKYLQGKNVGARRRVQLFKLAWDLLGEQFGSRQLQYEWFYAGDPIYTRSRFYHSPAVNSYKQMIERLLEEPA